MVLVSTIGFGPEFSAKRGEGRTSFRSRCGCVSGGDCGARAGGRAWYDRYYWLCGLRCAENGIDVAGGCGLVVAVDVATAELVLPRSDAGAW